MKWTLSSYNQFHAIFWPEDCVQAPNRLLPLSVDLRPHFYIYIHSILDIEYFHL